MAPTNEGSAPTRRVVQILNLLAEYPDEGFSLSRLVRVLGISKATCHAVLTTLVDSGYLTRHPATKDYWLGPLLVTIGRAAELRATTLVQASAQMHALSTTFGVLTTATALRGQELIVLERFPREIPDAERSISVGQRVLAAPPFGQVFMAWSDQRAIAAWLARDDQASATTVARRRQLLQEVHDRGYTVQRLSGAGIRLAATLSDVMEHLQTTKSRAMAQELMAELDQHDYSEEEIQAPGATFVTVISAPVFDRSATVSLSLSLWPQRELDAAQIAQFGQAVVAAAQRVSSAPAQPAPLEGRGVPANPQAHQHPVALSHEA